MNMMTKMSPQAEYSPAHLLNELKRMMQLPSDSVLARRLGIDQPIISRLRHNTSPLTGAILIRMHETSGLSIAELRHLVGDRRQRFRMRGGRHDAERQRKYINSARLATA